MLVAVPEQPLDPFQFGQQALTRGRIMMNDTTCVLAQHRQARGNMEPVKHVFGFRRDAFGQRTDLLAAVGQEGNS